MLEIELGSVPVGRNRLLGLYKGADAALTDRWAAVSKMEDI